MTSLSFLLLPLLFAAVLSLPYFPQRTAYGVGGGLVGGFGAGAGILGGRGMVGAVGGDMGLAGGAWEQGGHRGFYPRRPINPITAEEIGTVLSEISRSSVLTLYSASLLRYLEFRYGTAEQALGSYRRSLHSSYPGHNYYPNVDQYYPGSMFSNHGHTNYYPTHPVYPAQGGYFPTPVVY